MYVCGTVSANQSHGYTNTMKSATITTKSNEVPKSPGTRWNKMGVDGTEQDKRSKKANKARDMG